MQELPEGWRETAYKLIIFIPGVILGLSAKLAKINRDTGLTWKEFTYQALLAFSSAWLLWFILTLLGYDDNIKYPAAVVCGRWGDELMKFIWRLVRNAAKDAITSLLKNIK